MKPKQNLNFVFLSAERLKWENLGKRAEGEYPEWSQVIGLLVKFFTPICDVVSRGEIFIGDWLPQFGRYLD